MKFAEDLLYYGRLQYCILLSLGDCFPCRPIARSLNDALKGENVQEKK
jgi:hypothetical protein